jgi:hypothetical protein
MLLMKEKIMSTMKKLTALLICLVIVCGFAVSCTPEEPGTGDVGENGGNGNQNDGGDEELNFPTDKYVANVTVTFESDDLKMQDAIAAMGEVTYVVTADGTGLMIESSADIGSISLDEAYTYINGTLYHSTTLTSGDKSASSLEKAAMSDSDRDALLNKIGPGASIGKNDFLQLDMSKDGNYKTYTCSKIKSESADSLCKVFASKFNGAATVKLDSADYTLVLLGDANDSFILSCSFTVTMDGADYSVTMNMSCDYEYKDVSVSAPDNADKYSDAELSEIIG